MLRFNNSLQPVVGISLFEALAYCRWLSELTGEHYSLPDELQWEAAARGRGKERFRRLRKLFGDHALTPRRYAWGNRFLPDFCNSRDVQNRVQVGATTPVGLYAEGQTPDTGFYDLTGNVWEWTRSAYREQPPYDTELLDGLEDASQLRVVRGGCLELQSPRLRAPPLVITPRPTPVTTIWVVGCVCCPPRNLNPECRVAANGPFRIAQSLGWVHTDLAGRESGGALRQQLRVVRAVHGCTSVAGAGRAGATLVLHLVDTTLTLPTTASTTITAMRALPIKSTTHPGTVTII